MANSPGAPFGCVMCTRGTVRGRNMFVPTAVEAAYVTRGRARSRGCSPGWSIRARFGAWKAVGGDGRAGRRGSIVRPGSVWYSETGLIRGWCLESGSGCGRCWCFLGGRGRWKLRGLTWCRLRSWLAGCPGDGTVTESSRRPDTPRSSDHLVSDQSPSMSSSVLGHRASTPACSGSVSPLRMQGKS